MVEGSRILIRQFKKLTWEHSSAGRASALQAGGHRFEPCCSHQFLSDCGVTVAFFISKKPICYADGFSRSYLFSHLRSFPKNFKSVKLLEILENIRSVYLWESSPRERFVDITVFLPATSLEFIM